MRVHAHVHNLAALRGAGVIGASVRWAFTLAKLGVNTTMRFGIPNDERWRYRRLDALKASYGEDDGPPRLLKVEGVRIANGETVGVLAEVDVKRILSDAAERKANAQESWDYEFILALVEMLEQKGPCSQREAAAWLRVHRPQLFPGKSKNEPLAESKIRDRLAVKVGTGLAVTVGQRDTRIVFRHGKRNARELVFEDQIPTGPATGP